MPQPVSDQASLQDVLFNCRSGYVLDPTQKIRGLSPLHDSGTGSSLGRSYYYLGNNSFDQPSKVHMEILRLCHFFVPEVSTLVPRHLAPGSASVSPLLMVRGLLRLVSVLP